MEVHGGLGAKSGSYCNPGMAGMLCMFCMELTRASLPLRKTSFWPALNTTLWFFGRLLTSLDLFHSRDVTQIRG